MPLARLFYADGTEASYPAYRPAEIYANVNGLGLAFEAKFPVCDAEGGVVTQFSINGGVLHPVIPDMPVHAGVTLFLLLRGVPTYKDLATLFPGPDLAGEL